MNDNFLARRFFDDFGFDGVGNGMTPSFANVCNCTAHAGAVNLTRCCQCAHHNGNVVFFAFAIDHIGKQKSFAVGLGYTPPKLPANQGVQLGVLVDGAINGDQQPLLVKFGQVFVKITVAALFRLCWL